MAHGNPRTPDASSARTTSAQGNALSVAVDSGKFANIALNVSAVSGTSPTLDVAVQWSQDGGTTWFSAEPADTFTQITATKQVVKQFQVKAPLLRLSWTIGGTSPSFTFTSSVFVTQ